MNLLIVVIAGISEIVGTMAGFGSSTIFLPIALIFFDFRTALVLTALLHMFGNVGRTSLFARGLNRTLLIQFGIPSVLAGLCGALLVPYIPQDHLKGMLGLFLIVYGGVSAWKNVLRSKPTTNNMVLGGALSGFFAGLIGTGGALRGAFLSAYGLSKSTYIATVAVTSLLVDVTRIPVYLAQGFLGSEHYQYVLLLVIAAFVGTYTGKHIINHVPQRAFHAFVHIAIVVAGIWFVYGWLVR